MRKVADLATFIFMSSQTALHVASRHGKEKSVEALLAFNANALLQDKIERTAQSLASGTLACASASMPAGLLVCQRMQTFQHGSLLHCDTQLVQKTIFLR